VNWMIMIAYDEVLMSTGAQCSIILMRYVAFLILCKIITNKMIYVSDCTSVSAGLGVMVKQ
jgi:hypothetical protein